MSLAISVRVWKCFRIGGAFLLALPLLSNPVAADVTATPTPDEGLIDNFDNDGSFADSPGLRDGDWYGVTATAGATCMLETKYDATGNTFLSVACAAFGAFTENEKEKDYFAIKGLSRPGKKSDFSCARTITLDQNNVGMKFSIKFQDVYGLTTTASDEFANLDGHSTLNLTNMKWTCCDPRNIDQILFIPKVSYSPVSLTCTVDNFRVVESALPPAPAGLIDNFDNDGIQEATPWARDAKWWTSGVNIYTVETVPGCNGNNTACLHIRFQKPEGEEWAFVAAGNLNYPGKCREF